VQSSPSVHLPHRVSTQSSSAASQRPRAPLRSVRVSPSCPVILPHPFCLACLLSAPACYRAYGHAHAAALRARCDDPHPGSARDGAVGRALDNRVRARVSPRWGVMPRVLFPKPDLCRRILATLRPVSAGAVASLCVVCLLACLTRVGSSCQFWVPAGGAAAACSARRRSRSAMARLHSA